MNWSLVPLMLGSIAFGWLGGWLATHLEGPLGHIEPMPDADQPDAAEPGRLRAGRRSASPPRGGTSLRRPAPQPPTPTLTPTPSYARRRLGGRARRRSATPSRAGCHALHSGVLPRYAFGSLVALAAFMLVRLIVAMSLGTFPIQSLWAIGVLVVGAVVCCCWSGRSRRGRCWSALIGLPFAVVGAACSGCRRRSRLAWPSSRCAAWRRIALLLLPALEAEVPGHVAEAARSAAARHRRARVALASATDLLQAVVGLETLALSAVTLVALSAGDRPLEAAFKYFVLGAISLAGLLYGLGLVYLATGSFAFPTLAQVTGNPLLLAGVVLVVLGFAFELAVFPFHWGALDAYTAAAPSLAGYVMSASKLAAAFALGRLVVGGRACPPAQILVWVGSLTIIWGTFGALAQASDLRRMLAYSAVTHAASSPSHSARARTARRPPSSTPRSTAAWPCWSSPRWPARACGRRRVQPRAARAAGGALALGLLSLSGIPPTPGFWAKLAVLVVAWQSAGVVPTLIAVAGGVFSVLYYLRPLPELLAAMRARAATRPARRRRSRQASCWPARSWSCSASSPGLVWALAGRLLDAAAPNSGARGTRRA